MEELKNPAPRTPLNIEVDYKRNYAREESSGILKNISLTGAFLQFQGESLKSGEKLSLKVKVSGRERLIPAKVIWSNSMGAGVRFMPTNNRDIQIVDDLIYFVEEIRKDTHDVLDNIFKKVS